MLYQFKNWLKKILPPNLILFYHQIKAVIAALIYQFPAKKMIIIGVTGTNGKTTTVNLASSILETAGFKVAHASTINFKIKDRTWPNLSKMTTISPFELQKFLKKALKADCDYVILETTSHAVVQHRIWGIPFDVMIFTNLTHEHLDYHKNLTEYRNIKGKLFANLSKSRRKPGVKKISIINQQDPQADYFSKFPADLKLVFRVGGSSEEENQIVATGIYSDIDGSRFRVETPYGSLKISTHLLGKFNIQNILAALSLGISQNIDLSYLKKGIEKIEGVAGRMEKIDQGQDFAVIVDYAHTPDALKKVYETLKPLTRGKIIAVLGAAGDRDKTKRPIMGAIAGQFGDLVIITNEDPYGEDPMAIIDQVARGVPRGRRQPMKEGIDFVKIFDRRKAIIEALSKAEKDDVVIITGKGAEVWMVVRDRKIPWDDRKIVREILSQL